MGASRISAAPDLTGDTSPVDSFLDAAAVASRAGAGAAAAALPEDAEAETGLAADFAGEARPEAAGAGGVASLDA